MEGHQPRLPAISWAITPTELPGVLPEAVRVTESRWVVASLLRGTSRTSVIAELLFAEGVLTEIALHPNPRQPAPSCEAEKRAWSESIRRELGLSLPIARSELQGGRVWLDDSEWGDYTVRIHRRPRAAVVRAKRSAALCL